MGRAELKMLARLGCSLSAVQGEQRLEHLPGAVVTRLWQSQLLVVAQFLCSVGRGLGTHPIWLQLHLSACWAGLGVLTWLCCGMGAVYPRDTGH